MDSFIVMYIARRMADMGFKQYNFEPLIVAMPDNQNEYQLEGMNEYYYLTSKLLAVGTEISADNNYFKVEDYYANLDFSKIQEFTGQIRITSPQGAGRQVIEFIRVIPEISRQEDSSTKS